MESVGGSTPVKFRMCDGGVGANNLTLQTLPVARRIAEERTGLKGQDALKTVATLSLGTGDLLPTTAANFLARNHGLTKSLPSAC